jgi:acetoacetyl-CoA synthetase
VIFGQLRTRVETIADALQSCGVTAGDRTAAVISNCVEAIEMGLATLSIGAIWSTSSPDTGAVGSKEKITDSTQNHFLRKLCILFGTSARFLDDLKQINVKPSMKEFQTFYQRNGQR